MKFYGMILVAINFVCFLYLLKKKSYGAIWAFIASMICTTLITIQLRTMSKWNDDFKEENDMRSYTMNPFDYEKAWEQRFNLDVTKGMEVIVDNNKTF